MEFAKTYKDSHSGGWILAWFQLVPAEAIPIDLQQVKRFAWFLSWFHVVLDNRELQKVPQTYGDSHSGSQILNLVPPGSARCDSR